MLYEADNDRGENEKIVSHPNNQEIQKNRNNSIPFWENPKLLSFLNFLQLLVIALGIPFSIYTYYVNSKKERQEKRYLIYDSMDEKYWQYENLASQYPELGLADAIVADTTFDSFIKPDSLLTPKERIIVIQMMYLLISMHERAFLLYNQSDNEFMANQGIGWKEDLKLWIKKKKFMDVWESGGEAFDKNFFNYVNQLIAENNQKKPASY